MQDPSHTKRSKGPAPAPTPAAVATVAATALTAEPALLENIISFIPSFNETSGGAVDTTKPSAVLQTITTLCRAIPGLSQHVGPSNESFWRDMVLKHFDFSVEDEDIFNVEDYGGGEYGAYDSDAVDDEGDDEANARWHRHPQHGPLKEWARAHRGERMPDNFLVDGLHYWPSLETHFKPTAYGFLGEIQQDRSRMSALWPDHEDAFSLFCDLLLLPRFQSSDAIEWQTWSESDPSVYPCLMGRFPAKIVGRGFAMLKFCDFAPYFWDGDDEPVSKRWSGFDGPKPEVKCKIKELRRQKNAERAVKRRNNNLDGEDNGTEVEEEVDDDYSDDEDDDAHSDCEERSDEERSIFPTSTGARFHPFQNLRQFVYETFSDWRCVHINQRDMATPEFYIGRTKRSGRWMGFVGERQC